MPSGTSVLEEVARGDTQRLAALPGAVGDLGDPLSLDQGRGPGTDAREPRVPAHWPRHAAFAARGAEEWQPARAPAALASDPSLHPGRSRPSLVAALRRRAAHQQLPLGAARGLGPTVGRPPLPADGRPRATGRATARRPRSGVRR